MVTYCRNRIHGRCSWDEFKSIGAPATAAVVDAGWSCRKLDEISVSIHERRFDEEKLDRLRGEAKAKRRRVSFRNPSEPASIFE